MKEKIPIEVKRLYKKFNFTVKLYISLRWLLCPFEKIESYLPKKGVILDIGCGYGLLANYLAIKSTKRKVIGIDNNLKRLKIAKQTVIDNSRIEFINRDLRKLDLPKCIGVSISDVLHHLPEDILNDLLIEIYNKIEFGGKMIIEEVDTKPRWKYFFSILVDKIILYPKDKINFKSAKYWENLLKRIGFKVEIILANKGLPLSDIIFICTKK